ncbi:hypothetical protein [Streptomyces sp. H27-D2]|uniref:hypothetical protein n=1 Tax=Streptomyces sp. H27-D2 TaxID=3046304 RepID=UPI002DBAAB6A|nr:hypothetical protein [Streptomyces sp. H27-D2]MEC4018301.1 hypothetical protein [Streptomyces sp. H27-D2]
MQAQRPTRVQVSHHQYVLFDTDAEPLERGIDDILAGNGLVSVNSEATYASVVTGTSYGDVDVAFEVSGTEPPLRTDGWDEVVETSLYFPGLGPMVGGPVTDDLDLVPLLGPDEEYQWWRFRIHARGRDAASAAGDIYADEGDTVLEQHLLQGWPAPREPEVRHKLTDQFGTRSRTLDPESYARAKAAEAAHDAMPAPQPQEIRTRPMQSELRADDQI